jgi:MerR family copper efflux transcriptional regulator
MNIGQAAKAAGVNAKAIRYYESIGLIPPAARSDAGYRKYSDSDVATLKFIRRARDFGMPVDRIRVLVGLWRDRGRASAEVKRVALAHVADLDARIAELTAMSHALQHLAETCHGDQRPDCPILHDLAGGPARHEAMAPRHRGGAGLPCPP